MGNPDTEKASRYAQQLDDALCNARWQDVPELARKVEKHAPKRRCYTLASRAEAALATVKDTSKETMYKTTKISETLPELLKTLEEEQGDAQDNYQASVALGWIHVVLEEPGLAIARLTEDPVYLSNTLANKESELRSWTKVCMVKGAYIRGFALEKVGSLEDAINSYSSVLPYLATFKTFGNVSPQFRHWTELLLTQLCMLCNLSATNALLLEPQKALRAFRFWDKLTEIKPGQSQSSSGSPKLANGVLRRTVWKSYYDTLSVILQEGYRYNTSGDYLDPELIDQSERLPEIVALSSRLQQRAEIHRVETVYERLLLNETRFPKAKESNQEVEQWIEAVIGNWRVFCGSDWYEDELGEGGKSGVGRGVLDILYRASTKTFHSTQILRHLFVVHASLAEFDLSFKAFDSYVELVSRAKDRAEKSGDEDVGLDDDDTVIRTAAEAVRILCRFGCRKEAERSIEIGRTIERWLKQHTPVRGRNSIESSRSDGFSDDTTAAVVSPGTLAVAHRAIGIGLANWARLTYDASSRTTIQTDAVRHLRMSLDTSLGDPYNVESLYSLGLVLSEKRDISAAIKVAKLALSPSSKQEASLGPDGLMSGSTKLLNTSDFLRERKLIPLWHLLALLLSARSDYTTAVRSCDAAVEQFVGSTALFGSRDGPDSFANSPSNSPMLKGEEEKLGFGKTRAVVDQMESLEKEGLVQLKMTQLALVEVLEGSSTAVEACNELLSLYARLFGDPKAGQAEKIPTNTKAPPKSAAGSIRRSFSRRARNAQNTTDASPTRVGTGSAASQSQAATTQAALRPEIHVTDEDSSDMRFSQISYESPTLRRSGSTKLQKRSTASLRMKAMQDSVPEMPSYSAISRDSPLLDEQSRNGSVTPSKHRAKASLSSSIRKSFESHEQPLRTIPQSHSSQDGVLAHISNSNQPSRQDTRLPISLTKAGSQYIEPRFNRIQERRHQISLLTHIWIFISQLYSNAAMFEDANGAIDEATVLVTKLEIEISQENAGAKNFSYRGWGGGKSLEELWADVYAARGSLNFAQNEHHVALAYFEKSVTHFPDHPSAIVGLSSILLDMYSQKISLEPSTIESGIAFVPAVSQPNTASSRQDQERAGSTAKGDHNSNHSSAASAKVATPVELYRIAARDRAYGLLSSLTKLGSGWDYSEAWFALARAYEEGGQIEKAKGVLWWCIDLEDTKPLRGWRSICAGGYVL